MSNPLENITQLSEGVNKTVLTTRDLRQFAYDMSPHVEQRIIDVIDESPYGLFSEGNDLTTLRKSVEKEQDSIIKDMVMLLRRQWWISSDRSDQSLTMWVDDIRNKLIEI